MMKLTRVFPICLVLILMCPEAGAACFAGMWGGTGKRVESRERAGMSMFWAHASWDPDGWPAITYGPMFYQLPDTMQKLTRLHECAHLTIPTMDEFAANCAALRVMRREGLSPAEEQYIGQFHMNIGVLPPQYGGSGLAFWNGTMQLCGPRGRGVR